MDECTRRTLIAALATLPLACAGAARAQFGGGCQRGGGDYGNGGRSRIKDSSDAARPAKPIPDPSEAIVRELPSLRVDLKLAPEQVAAFDGFERQMRDLADVSRDRARHVQSYRHDDGNAVRAVDLLETLSNDDAACAQASKLAHERLQALYAVLDRDQRQHFDRRIGEALRDPLGSG